MCNSESILCCLSKFCVIWKTNVWECEGGPTTTPTRTSETRSILRSWDPVERLVRDAVPPEKEAQLGRMFLDVAHGVQLELYIAHRIFTGPGEMEQLVRLLV